LNAAPHREVLTVSEAAAALGIGRTLAYGLARQGKLPTIRLGARVVVPRARLDELLGVDCRRRPELRDARPRAEEVTQPTEAMLAE